MSKVTNTELLEIHASLKYLATRETSAWYQVGRNLKKITPLVDELNDARNSIIEKLVKKDKEGNWIHKDDAKTQWDLGNDQQKADELWQKTTEEIVEVDFYTFKYELLAGDKLNPQAITPLIDTIILEE